MKKYMVIATLALASLGLLGCQQPQKAPVETVTPVKTETVTPPAVMEVKAEETMALKDGVRMIDGNMMVVKNGVMSEMMEDMTMSDGTKVMTDGKMMMKDGTTTMMKDGQMMDMTGKMMMEAGVSAEGETKTGN